jgi:DNA end-binding protein Ku
MRSIWTGTISFLLLSFSVKLYNAIETSEKISFNQLHSDCFGNIGYTKQCKKCGAVVSNEEIVKGYEYDKGQYVVVSPDEISSIAPKSNESIEVIGFIDPNEVPTTYFDASYFVAPNGPAAGKAYSLLRDAMNLTGLIAIAKVILRDREELITLTPNADGLILQKLHYRHEVRDHKQVPGLGSLPATNQNELELAQSLVTQMVTTFDEIDTTDHFHANLKQMLETKIAGGTIEIKKNDNNTAPVVDIMSALRASLKARSEKSTTASSASSTPKALTLLEPTATGRKGKRKTA